MSQPVSMTLGCAIPFLRAGASSGASHQAIAVCQEAAAGDYKDRDALNNGFLMSHGIFGHVLRSLYAALFSEKKLMRRSLACKKRRERCRKT
ncbi:hypothetical protein [Pseudomonas sp. SLFW]|uniref:hypothetical protein n=1 Tax=Pseudomonas sp. SLFW TaxID=2683259 RepID=UPI001411DF1F|nr:hypothetical protein [Pseudomonas sp. SLFW]